MALERWLVTLNMDTGLAEDAATNTWYFETGIGGGSDTPGVQLRDWYQAVGGLLSDLIDPANITITRYDMADPPPRAPLGTSNILQVTTGTAAGPTEVALVMSFQADKISGESQARRRGRVYLGPLTQTAFDRPSSAVISTVVNASQTLLDASVGATDWKWVVWSPTAGSFSEVTNGWVDNEWDTQRRRGRRRTSRSVFN